MTDSSMSNAGRKAMSAETYADALASLRKVADFIEDMRKRREEIMSAMPECMALAAKAHVYRLFGLVHGKERFEARDLPAVHDVMRRFTEALPVARRYYEEAAGGTESRFLPVDENIRVAASANDPELRQYQDEFRQAWNDNMLGLIKNYVHDQFKLVNEKRELDIEDFLTLYEDAFVFYFILDDERKRLEARKEEQ